MSQLSSRLVPRLAVAGMTAAVFALGGLVVWVTHVSGQHSQRMAATGVQAAGHLRALQALGQMDTATDEMESGVRPAPLARMRHAQVVLDESLRRMARGTIGGERELARLGAPDVARLRPLVARFLAAVRSPAGDQGNAASNRMELVMERLQLRFADLDSDPSMALSEEAVRSAAFGRSVTRSAAVVIPLGLIFTALCAWQLSAYRRRTESVLIAASSLSEHDARTDELTGLPNRRALYEELDARAARDDAFAVVIADLNGFKRYNDTFGHAAGDALLKRLGEKLIAACEGRAIAARLGGDEFCVIGDEAATEELAALVRETLTETGEGFDITCEAGAARVPHEAVDGNEALRLADARMYADKADSRPVVDDNVVQLLLGMLDERHPGLGEHVGDVADLATECARTLGLPPDDIRDVHSTAELHDIGKIAIPTSIIAKPGRLTADEWEFIKGHTVIGQRVLSAVPSMQRVGTLVRSSHERWDGTGYPDHLAGRDIPIGSRIVSVADAFCAMTEHRVYSDSRPPEDAIAELKRCAGTQFDPEVVEAFVRSWNAGAGRRHGAAVPLALR